jgi:hypothetical protein
MMPQLGRSAPLAVVCVLSLGLALRAQQPDTKKKAVPPPPAPAPKAKAGAAKVDPAMVADLAHQLAEQLRRLSEDSSTSLQPSAEKDRLIHDTTELAQAADELQAQARDQKQASRLRQIYTGIDGSWHELSARLAQPGFATFSMTRAARSVDAIDDKLHELLGVNELPETYYNPTGPVPSGLAETRRLARTLDDRAHLLSVRIPNDLPPSPERDALAGRAQELGRATDDYYDTLPGVKNTDEAQNFFAPLATVADQFGADLRMVKLSPSVASAWQGFLAAYSQARQQLGLPPAVMGEPAPPPGRSTLSILPLTDQLIRQVDTFLQSFAPTAGAVPEGAYFLDDAARLRYFANDFRKEVVAGLSAPELAYEFRDVDVTWQRLARRVQRVARGRNGPNIQLAMSIGDTCAAIHRVLALPGYPPDFIPLPEHTIGPNIGPDAGP